MSSRKREFCEHCDQWLDIPVFKRHNSMYFRDCIWNKEVVTSDEEDDNWAGFTANSAATPSDHTQDDESIDGDVCATDLWSLYV